MLRTQARFLLPITVIRHIRRSLNGPDPAFFSLPRRYERVRKYPVQASGIGVAQKRDGGQQHPPGHLTLSADPAALIESMKNTLTFLAATLFAVTARAEDVWTPLPSSAWRWYGHKKEEGLPSMWSVEADGSLHRAPGNGAWQKGDLITNEGSLHHFELELEWKVGKTANSGILYRIKDGQSQPSQSGFEYQILDDIGFKNGKSQPFHRAGALYAILSANDQKVLKPVEEWNTTRIVAHGSRLKHWLNGQCVLRVDLSSPEFQATYAKSQWKGNPSKGAIPNGFIALQDHGGEVWYRNIRVKKLSSP